MAEAGGGRAALPAPADVGRLQRRYYTLQECLRSALGSILAHRLRSTLTMLGVIIGVASVICVIALIQGLTSSIYQQFEGLGANVLTLRAYTPTEDALRGKLNRLRLADIEALRYRAAGISNIAPVAPITTASTVRYGSNTASGPLYGTTSNLQAVQSLSPRVGRFLTVSDDDTGRRVVVLGEQTRKDLKLPDDPTGQFVEIGREWFKVVGVLEPRGEIMGQSLDSFLVMPYETALAVNGLTAEPNMSISFTVNDPDAVDNVKQQVAALIRRIHDIGKGQPDDFRVQSSESLFSTFKTITTTVTLVVAGIVGISLLVGGIGIMNIMLVSVTERTREIGIAKALGATRRIILLQFLIEAMLLALIGGLIGIGLGFALAWAIAGMIPNFPSPTVPWWAVTGSCLFSLLVGMGFGILPASKAANLTPIDALRYE